MIHPSRSSSLHGRPQSSEAPYAQQSASAQTIFENGQYQERPAPNQESSLSHTKNGQQELAGTRAQLLAIQRRILEHVGKTLNWNVGWAAVLPSLDPKQEFADVDLDDNDESEKKNASDDEEADDEEESESKTAVPNVSIVGVSATTLKDSISSIDKFRQSYEVNRTISALIRYELMIL